VLAIVEGAGELRGVLYGREDGRITLKGLRLTGGSGERAGIDALGRSELCARGWKKLERTV
jgi:hypothetical protein